MLMRSPEESRNQNTDSNYQNIPVAHKFANFIPHSQAPRHKPNVRESSCACVNWAQSTRTKPYAEPQTAHNQ